MTISAKIIADSKNRNSRITTFELEFPRFILAEFNTHRLFSRNAQSSRAVPTNKFFEQILSDPAIPVHWGKNQPGMFADEEHDEWVSICEQDEGYWEEDGSTVEPSVAWTMAMKNAMRMAKSFADAGYHKQIVNRLVEPFANIRVVVTATEYENFFHLRMADDAQPEIRELATLMHDLYRKGSPEYLMDDEWHMPYYSVGSWSPHRENEESNLLTALKVSASCCAQVSYRNLDDSVDKAENIYNMLVMADRMHASPLEHQAASIFVPKDKHYSEVGYTHMKSDPEGNSELWSGNFRGWVQYRQTLDNHTKWD